MNQRVRNDASAGLLGAVKVCPYAISDDVAHKIGTGAVAAYSAPDLVAQGIHDDLVVNRVVAGTADSLTSSSRIHAEVGGDDGVIGDSLVTVPP